MDYCIELRNKHTGEVITLGSRYPSKGDAVAAIDNDEFCRRCNDVSVRPIYAGPDSVWQDKHAGFVA